MLNSSFWKGKRVFLTGHTGFKGSWLCLLLNRLGAIVTGYALAPTTPKNLFELASIKTLVKSVTGDIRDYPHLASEIKQANPDIIIHMAAQPLVGYSYTAPLLTYETNVMGTVHLYEAIRQSVLDGAPTKVVLNVTTDKCYENKEWSWGYRENDQMGGSDPYSNSKACSELITSSYRSSFFPCQKDVVLSTARSGNVIGGGDWTPQRLVPDLVHAISSSSPLTIRNTNAVRPWQHVLDPLYGYLLLTQSMYTHEGKFSGSWNFGPSLTSHKPVSYIIETLCEKWEKSLKITHDETTLYHETKTLMLDCTKAHKVLHWAPKWEIDIALEKVVQWFKAVSKGADARSVTEEQIMDYLKGRVLSEPNH
ncbi:CDP-glucose 4,6-dehydratase [Alteribacter aurantiacus]|uniref:CDP-glucose 4,6-dehydratase n=1 Tax=Alteribacter aurantiacus TaxID=254410 RepID=UPI0003FD2032|nr:CDP-glucose 4,6-dehydratase [Alteribacter aurantiacus]